MMNKFEHLMFPLIIASLLIWSLATKAFAQNPVLINTIANKKIDKVSIDRKNNIYITDIQGNVEGISESGELINIFSSSLPTRVHLMESWQGIRNFIFYKERQEYILLDRFLNRSGGGKIDQSQIGFARLATIANDNNIWVIDDSDFSLKKYHSSTRNISLITPLNTILPEGDYDFIFMKEYQNQLFIAEPETGIHIFDNLGNYIKNVPTKNVQYFNFINDELYYIENGNVTLINLYTSEKKVIDFPAKQYKYVLISADHTFLFTEKEIHIYKK